MSQAALLLATTALTACNGRIGGDAEDDGDSGTGESGEGEGEESGDGGETPGAKIWSVVFDLDGYLGAVASAPDGGVVVTGAVEQRPFVAKLDGDGGIEWSWTGDSEGRALAVDVTGNGRAVVVGWVGSSAAAEAYVWSFDVEGNMELEDTHAYAGFSDFQFAIDVELGADDSIYFVAGYRDAADQEGYAIAKLSDEGSELWDEGGVGVLATGIALDQGAPIAALGTSLRKLSSGGDELWSSQLTSEGRLVARAPTGDLVVAGTTYDGGQLAWVAQLPANGGTPNWERSYDESTDPDQALGVAVDSESSVLLATGDLELAATSSMLRKLDASGEEQWAFLSDDAEEDGATFLDLTAGDEDHVFAVGWAGPIDAPQPLVLRIAP